MITRSLRLLAFAKLSSEEARTSEAVRKLLDSAAIAVKHSACLLGRVTHAANNHIVEAVSADGTTVQKTIRDATEKPRSYSKKLRQPSQASMTAPSPALPTCSNGAAPTSSARKRPYPSHGLREASAEAANTLRRVEEIGTALPAPAGGAPARERLDLLARRVRARLIPD